MNRREALSAFGSGLLWALLGVIIVPIAIFVLGLILTSSNPSCGAPGDSGGCAMGVFGNAIAAALPGAALGFLYGLVRAFRRRTK